MKHPVRKFVRIAGSEKSDKDHCVKKKDVELENVLNKK